MRFLFVLVLLIPFHLLGQTQDSLGYFVRQEGDTVIMYSDPRKHSNPVAKPSGLEMSAQFINYFDKVKKQQPRQESQKQIKELHFGNRVFINLPIASLGMDRLQEVIMANDRYVLTSYYGGTKFVLYIYDITSMEVVVKKLEHSDKEKKDLSTLNNVIKKYFTECPKAMELIEKGIKDWHNKETRSSGGTTIFQYISNYDCKSN